jgi:flotillin
MAEKVAAPMGSIDKLTVISTDGAAALPKQVADNVLQTMQLLQDTTGVDLAGIVGGLGKKDVVAGETE